MHFWFWRVVLSKKKKKKFNIEKNIFKCEIFQLQSGKLMKYFKYSKFNTKIKVHLLTTLA